MAPLGLELRGRASGAARTSSVALLELNLTKPSRGSAERWHGFLRVCGAGNPRPPSRCCLHVSYGQRTEQRERRALEERYLRPAPNSGSQLLRVRNEALRAVAGSALTNSGVAGTEAPAIGASITVNVPVDVRPFPQCAFSRRRRQLGGSAGSPKKSTLERLSLIVPVTPIAD